MRPVWYAPRAEDSACAWRIDQEQTLILDTGPVMDRSGCFLGDAGFSGADPLAWMGGE